MADLAVMGHISLLETYALLCLGVAAYFRQFISLSVKVIQGLCCLSLMMLIGFFLIYNKASDQGLFARYFANNHWAGMPQQSTEFQTSATKEQSFTRIDPQVNFSSRGFDFKQSVFPVFFLNDEKRYGGEYVTEDRLFAHKHFLFSSTYAGYIQIPENTELTVSAQAGKVSLSINGQRCESELECSLGAEEGIQPIEISYQRLSTVPPSLTLYWHLQGTREAVPAKALRLTDKPQPLTLLNFVNMVFYILLVCMIALLLLGIHWRAVWQTAKDELIIIVLCMLSSVYFLLLCHQKGAELSTLIFSPGNDWLVYETQARLILFGDWLNAGYTEGGPFFWNIGYRYFLAVLHWTFGENPLRIVFYQYLLLVGGLFVSHILIKRLFGAGTGILFLIVLLTTNEIFHYPRNLLDTTFSILLPWLGLLALLSFQQSKHQRYLLVAGLCMGLAVVVRGNFLPFIMLSALWVYFTSSRNRFEYTALYLLLPCFLLSLVGLRNWLVAGHFMILPASGTHNLWLAHRFTDFSDFAFSGILVPDKSELTRVVIDNIISDPAGLIYRSYQKLLHIMGFNITKGFRLNANILILNLGGILSAIYLLSIRVHIPAVILLMGWAFTVAGSLLIIFPWGYGFRLQAPMFLPLILLITLGLSELKGRLPIWRRKEPALS